MMYVHLPNIHLWISVERLRYSSLHLSFQ